HVRPLLLRSQHLCVEPVVQFAHAITRVRHPNKNRRSYRDEAFYLAQSNFEGIGMAANLLEKLQRGKLIPLQTTRRQYGEVGRERSEAQLPPPPPPTALPFQLSAIVTRPQPGLKYPATTRPHQTPSSRPPRGSTTP